MKKAFAALIGIFLLVTASPGLCQTTDDFAYGLELEPARSAALMEISLPAVVYETITRTDLGDIRVFNGQGEVIPHGIKAPERQTPARPVALPFFPLHPEPGDAEHSMNMQVTTNDKGMIVSLKTAQGAAGDQAPSYYILDASSLKKSPSALKLAWTGREQDMTATVNVEASSDLSHWTRLASGAALADLSFGDNRLVRDTIHLTRFSGKYLRLNWPVGKKGFLLTRVQAMFPSVPTRNKPQTKELASTSFDEKTNDYFFDSQGLFPVTQITVNPPQQNTLAQITLSTRSDLRSEWRTVYQGQIYNLEADGQEFKNEPVSLNGKHTRYYRLRVRDAGGFGAGRPAIHIMWRPESVFFAARGSGPFTLAYGSALISPLRQDIGPLLANLNSLEKKNLVDHAASYKMVQLGGPDRLTPAQPPVPWKAYVLWALLILGVLLLAFMAQKLYRDMNRQ